MVIRVVTLEHVQQLQDKEGNVRIMTNREDGKFVGHLKTGGCAQFLVVFPFKDWFSNGNPIVRQATMLAEFTEHLS